MSDLSSFFRSVVWPWVHSLANLKWHSSFSSSNLRVNLPLLQRAHLYTPGADRTNPPPTPPSALSYLPKSLLYIFLNIIEILFWPEGNLILTQYVLFWGARRLRNTVSHLSLSPSPSVFCFISFWSHNVWQIYISSMPAMTILITLRGIWWSFGETGNWAEADAKRLCPPPALCPGSNPSSFIFLPFF